MSSDEHREQASQTVQSVTCAIITASDSRTPETDESGKEIRHLLETNGHQVTRYQLVKDEPAQIGQLLDELTTANSTVQIILINGGTGIAPRDRTYDAVSVRLEKVLPGFGEIFRMLSYQEVGAAAMLSRAIAGVYRGRMVVSMPGSLNAVNLAMTRLILPEIQHLAWELGRK
jgi:molybdenum cofactor biosynthesis protein B